MQRDNYEFDILVNGKPVKTYLHEGRFYVEGKKGTNYSLRIKNNGWRRILVIPSIDGLNAITGKLASVTDSGYIVNGYSSMTIDGWRTSDKEVAEFYFSSPSDSYADKKGKEQNVGIIGCAIFKEKQWSIFDWTNTGSGGTCITTPWIFPGQTSYTSSSSNNLTNGGGGGSGYVDYHSKSVSYNSADNLVKCSSNDNGVVQNACYNLQTGKPVQQELGTGFGEKKRSEVTTVSFEREYYPTEVFEVMYNTRAQLEKMGIDLSSHPQYVAPSAFPADTNGYCEPPER